MKLTKNGTDYRLVKSAARKGAMPKRGAPLELVVNGNPVKAIVTTNAAWCGAPDLTLEYIWIEVAPGVANYVTLAYGEKAASWAGEEVLIVEGTGPKPTLRVTGTGDRGLTEYERTVKFSATWNAKRAPADETLAEAA